MGRHFLHVFSTFDAGGPQVRTARILDLMPRSDRHTVVAMDGRIGCADRVASDVRMELEPAPAVRGTWRTASAMGEMMRRLQPDAVLTYNWGAIETLLGAWRIGYRSVVHHEEGFGTEENERLLLRRNWTRRLLLPRARALIVPSRTLERIATSAWKQPASHVHYLPNGVDLERFAPRERPDDDVVIGSVASFRPVKNHPLLLAAFAQMSRRAEARLLMYGDGPERGAVESLARDLGVADRVTFAGQCADTAEAYPQMDVFAMSSHSEQMPIVVLEAMACGLPVVATDVGDIADMIVEANRELVVAPGDSAALAAALDRAVADRQLRETLGQQNRAKCAEQFEERRCLGRYIAMYEQAASA